MKRPVKLSNLLSEEDLKKVCAASDRPPPIFLSKEPVHSKFGFIVLRNPELDIWPRYIGRKVEINLYGRFYDNAQLVAILPKKLINLSDEDAYKCGYPSAREFQEFLAGIWDRNKLFKGIWDTEIYLLIFNID